MQPQLVSIIMPTYNRDQFILESIESIRQQTYTHWELLIIDDGSTDTTEQLATSIDDARIYFIKAGRIGVGGKIKNIGLQYAEGGLIAFNDSDDLWAPTKLERQMNALLHYPEAGFCLCGGYNFKELSNPLEYFYKQHTGEKSGNFFIDFFKSQLPGFTQALLLRKECFEKTGPFREVKAFSDVDFIATLAYHYKGIIVYEPLVYRRLHQASYSSPNWIKSYHEGIQLINDFREKLPSSLYHKALFKAYINFGESYLNERQSAKAIQQFMCAWRHQLISIVPIKKTGKAILRLLSGK